jgi:hypothetical protein
MRFDQAEFNIHFPAVLAAETLASLLVVSVGSLLAWYWKRRRGDGHKHSISSDTAAILHVLERQNELLSELLAASASTSLPTRLSDPAA